MSIHCNFFFFSLARKNFSISSRHPLSRIIVKSALNDTIGTKGFLQPKALKPNRLIVLFFNQFLKYFQTHEILMFNPVIKIFPCTLVMPSYIQWNGSGTPVNTTNGPKNFGLINEGFFLQENAWRFLPGCQKSGLIFEVAVKRGFTVDSY